MPVFAAGVAGAAGVSQWKGATSAAASGSKNTQTKKNTEILTVLLPVAICPGGTKLNTKASSEPPKPIAPSSHITPLPLPLPRRKGRGAEGLKRDFPLPAEELMRRLGLHAGGDLRLAFTKSGGDFWTIRLK